MTILTSYHQTFINAVRSTGGRNAYRTLVVQGPLTDFDFTYNLMNAMPTDTVARRMMVEVHDYIPYNFTIMEADARLLPQLFEPAGRSQRHDALLLG